MLGTLNLGMENETIEEIAEGILVCMNDLTAPKELADGEHRIQTGLIDWAERAPTGNLMNPYTATVIIKDGKFEEKSIQLACAKMVKEASYHGRFAEAVNYYDCDEDGPSFTPEEVAARASQYKALGLEPREFDDTIKLTLYIGS